MVADFDIVISEPFHTESFESLHWMAYRLGDDRVCVDLTGIVLLGVFGGTGWVRKTLRLGISGRKAEPLLDLEPPKEDHYWAVDPFMWSVSAAPASMFNQNEAVNAGWAVDSCDTAWDLGESRKYADLLGTIILYMNLAVSDTDGILYRVSYDFRGIGTLEQRRIDRSPE